MEKKRKPIKAETAPPSSLPGPPDDVVTFSVRVRESMKARLKHRAADRGSNLQAEIETALNLYLAESTAEKMAAMSPFPDARPDELETLGTFLALMRSGPSDVRTILRSTARHFGQTILKKTA